MNYTIATMEEMGASGHSISLIANGNKYYIELSAEGERTVRKHFDDISEAAKLFQKFAGAFATSCYSYEDRASWLA